MNQLSPAAQAVYDAYYSDLNPYSECDPPPSVPAVLRAAALYCKQDRLMLMAIADELEAR